MSVVIVVPSWDNFDCLVRCIESIRDLTRHYDYRIVVVDNGSKDQTPNYLRQLQDKMGKQLTVIVNEANLGFVKATNQGLSAVKGGENVLWLNDDTQITDPHWLNRLESDLIYENAGAVGPVSNFVMGLQNVSLSYQLPARHDANFLIGFCLLVSADAFHTVGLLDERFGMGGNDDLDYCIRLIDAGYKLIVEREAFVLHYGAQSIQRIGGYDKVEAETRPKLVEKWGQARVDKLFETPESLKDWHPA